MAPETLALKARTTYEQAGIELMLEIATGPATGPEAVETVRPYALPGTDAKLQFATSLPA